MEWIGVTAAIIAKCTDAKTPQPVFAIARKNRGELEPLLTEERSLVVVLDGVQDPGNVGTIIRSADAVGANGVIVGLGCADIYNPKVIRSTMGSLFHLPVIEGDLADILPQAKARGSGWPERACRQRRAATHMTLRGRYGCCSAAKQEA